ncbi:4-amino-4-deoxy-L-arabinose transferase-like glycosyltransferase [Sphaerotilus hippei]|uniref:4-amino-4-deoxy-L-arabinose transferase-like glycosyltransferase n=1 Tax=Sphaerotilus hippei TaxID=744406 RepID=A0A318GZU5_9BURK|nr:glycosyltransferase family 39 protein [Sphaerotilus hippei]PXW95804.1 4-amino-4-deoxy-L-arabinose transferase-like glycosyltransferase [Sphaerotilus hippei]
MAGPSKGASISWRATAATDPGGARLVLWWALAMAIVALLRIGAAPLFDVDEGAFSEATREMLASGDWGHTTLNGEPRFDKPILIYWLQAASVAVFGLGELALRLPSALATWGWALALVLFAWPRWGAAAAVAAGSVLGTSVGVLLIGRAATADAVLNLWLTLAALDLWRHLEGEGDRGALRRAALWIGLGVLTKGPVAIIVPGAAWLLWTLCAGRAAWLARARALLGDAPAWVILLLVALPWYVYALDRHGMAFIDGFFVRHNLQRYGGTLEGHGGSIGYYALMMPLLLMPWSVLLLPVLAGWRRWWAEPAARFLLLWAGFVLVFFSLSGTKLPHYALYGISPLALLAGRCCSELTGRADRRVLKAALGLCVMLLPLLAVLATAIVLRSLDGVKDALYRALIGQPADLTGLWIAAVAAAGLSLVLAGPPVWRRTGGARSATPDLVRIGLAAAAGALVLTGVLAPWWGQQLQGPVRAAGQRARIELAAPDTPARATLVQWGLHLPSVAVYARREAPRRAPRPGDLALLRSDQLQALTTTLAADPASRRAADVPADRPVWTSLHSAGGLTLIRWHGVPAAP